MARDWLEILQEMEQWSRDLDRFMTHMNTRSRSMMPSLNYLAWSPSVNIYETEDALLVMAELAGVTAEDINIKYENRRLLVWGERRALIQEGVRAVHRMEIQLGPFAFVVDLPGMINADGAEAKLQDGILLIHLPKRSAAESGPVQIRPVEKEEKGRGNE